MKWLKSYYILFLLSILLFLIIQNTGCQKEYSFEGAGADTLTVMQDSNSTDTNTHTTTINFPQCSSCDESEQLTMNSWSFKTYNAYVCGKLTNPGFIGGNSRTSFTLFGPSACSNDTGIVVSIYLPVPLDQDRHNISASAAFYYYDDNAPKDIFISNDSLPFSVTIESYILSTGIVTGTFEGSVLKANDDTAIITSGNFVATLH